jgi:7-cyano-7-deazaguanine synthase
VSAAPPDSNPVVADDEVAVLASGGVDSAILVAELLRHHAGVHPIYVRFGLAWEATEEAHLRSFLETLTGPSPRPLVVLDVPIAPVYGSHWSLSGADVPDDRTTDDAVYLPGRNLLLLALPSVWCALHGVHAIALGTLKGNPFPDATDAFFANFSALVQRGMDHVLEVLTPFAGLVKAEVLELGRGLALERTFSCIDPQEGRHCGRCNKCAERAHAFSASSIEDTTDYVHRSDRGPARHQ